MRLAPPVQTLHLFDGLHSRLLELLRGLTSSAWDLPTVCRGWAVRDIVAHMLDTQVRLLSGGRDSWTGLQPGEPLAGYGDLVRWLDEINGEWVRSMRRVSPRVLVDFLAVTGPQMREYMASLDPDAPARFPVAWSGDTVSPNWFGIGRDYTEYWHHQQQIRDATGAEPLNGREWLHPVLALFMRAVPRAFAGTACAGECSVQVCIEGEAGGEWVVVREAQGWTLFEGRTQGATAEVRLTDDTAWRIFTKGLSREAAERQVHVQGDAALGALFLRTVAVMG